MPNNIHQRARNLIRYSVAILLFTALFGFHTTDGMDWNTYFGTRSVRLELLDYPLLATIVVPMMLILFYENWSQLSRSAKTKFVLKETPPSPEIEIEPCSSDKI